MPRFSIAGIVKPQCGHDTMNIIVKRTLSYTRSNRQVDDILQRSSATRSKLLGKHRFVDIARIIARGGDGGDGCVSFQREKFLPKGPPNGGNGGRGGNVIIRASTDESTLRHVGHMCSAKRGQSGLGSGRTGMTGNDLIINVPVGTIVREIRRIPTEADEDDNILEKRWVFYPRADQPGEPQKGRVDFFQQAQNIMNEEDRYLRWRARHEISEPILIDLNEPDQDILVCRGGTGGYGNHHFLTTENRSPKWATRGRRGEVREIELELKMIADVGLVGLPNAGKSTLLGAVSNAHPKQAAYPFTTLHPFVGTIDYADRFQLTVADIPGIIRGAHLNIGLGHAFLRHVERAKLLVYVIDLSRSAPWEDFLLLQQELDAYRPGLTARPSIIVANKADQVTLAKENLTRLQETTSLTIVPVSARYARNIEKLTSTLRTHIQQIRRAEADQS